MLIDLDDVRNDIPGVIALKGANYVYEKPDGYNCVYINSETQTPSCLIGYYLVEKLRVPASVFLAGMRSNYLEFPDIESFLQGARGILFTDEASEALTELQVLQDDGVSWGEAYQQVFGETL